MVEIVVFIVGVWAIVVVANFATCGITRRTLAQAGLVTGFFGVLLWASLAATGHLGGP